MGLPITVYHRPNGRQENIICNNIEEDDANWFITRSVKVSMEESGSGGHILYADYGAVDEDGEPDEVILVTHRSCPEAMSSLREMTERAMAS